MQAPDTQMGLAFPRRVLSYGGGLDSFAMLLDAIERGDKPDLAVFCDVSNGNPEHGPEDPGEWSGTYRHIREVVIPLCRKENIEFVWLDTVRYPVRDAKSLFAWMWARGQIPVAGDDRLCTTIAKVERFETYMNERFPGEHVEVWIGFDAAELRRVEKDPNAGGKKQKRKLRFVRTNRFPLIERNLCRCRCVELVRRLGYPVPRKSACVFCPYASLRDWQTLARQAPETFAKIAELEARKPPTSSGKKLSIMGFKTKKDETGAAIGYRAPALPIYIQGKPRNKREPCSVCGAAQKATKETGCDWLEETGEAAA